MLKLNFKQAFGGELLKYKSEGYLHLIPSSIVLVSFYEFLKKPFLPVACQNFTRKTLLTSHCMLVPHK